MKKIFFALITLYMFVFASAQSEKYAGFMKQNLVILDSAKTPDDLQNAANGFERIASAEKEQWQPYYYSVYSLVMKCFYSKDKSGVDAMCDKADEMLAIAESLNQNNSEITTLKSMTLTARMQVDNSRFMTMGKRAGELLQQALQQQPANNPRTLMQIAQNKYYTPAAFGGGKDAGIDALKKALDAYNTFKPATDLDPDWGKSYAERLLKQWSQ